MSAHQASILVVDDTPANLTLMTGLLQDDYQVRAAISGEKALQIANSDSPPDLILLDIMMPQMDGYEVCRRLKADTKTQDIPVIFLTAMSEAEDEEKGLSLGAVDYITKPISPSITLARIQTHITLYQQKKALVESQRALAAELHGAAEYIFNALPAPIHGQVSSHWKHIPSTALGGDAFGYHWIDEDHLAIYLLDVCGHGVGSALMSVSAINILRSQSLTSADFKSPASVLGAINNAFPMEEHNNKYFTIWYGVYQRSQHLLRFASAAHPPAVLMTQDMAGKQTWHELKTQNLMIGFDKDTVFKESSIALEEKNKFYVFSDGVYEIEQANGQVVTLADFIDLLKRISKMDTSQVDDILQYMKKLASNADSFEDDFSLLELMIQHK
jgi:sigma-B regulation protein RsbU (phosphoserine phosphatase)